MVYLSSEIVLEILQYAGHDIIPCLRINSQWFNCGISLVWRRARSWLLSRVPKHRRQIYASVIREFIVYRETNKNLREFSQLSFPKLEMLRIDLKQDDHDALDFSSLKCYMRQGLTQIELSGTFDPELLSLIQVSCPRLYYFSISRHDPRLTPEILLEFLQNYPALSDISIHSEELITGNILKHLAGSKKLETLSLEGVIDTDAIGDLNISSPFKALQHLTISVTEAALPSLVGMVKSIRSFNLTLGGPDLSEDFDSAALKHISQLIELRNLTLLIWGNMRIATEDIVSLKSLTHLRRFSISGLSAISLIAPRLQDTDFEELFKNLGQLEALNFDIFRSNITTDSLVSLGKCCPSLQRCEIMGIYDMAAFRYEKLPLFPALELLSIGAFTNCERLFSYSRAYDHVRQIEKHFPNLQDLGCTFRTFPIVKDELPDKIVQLWWSRQEKARKAKP
ncbi:hypothetical protein BDV38DRAFT_277674 [Aspergillus pseudotamarii]|uniref:F-box domain-containing protein n=1 Tax=Aspergillus pseudotamarii TaxID=132259 RepID=A0A5N6T977_ASPPS|nr:uncharacterized protein BDV38DRAFT_277674 [Aspergillus pseudotamarii]KAE8142862.1 hypothetical protein BDV38DRAFT_277674 [Aspergillus pseudotamarii]